MYEWLEEALRENSQVVTANRRLSRVLAAEYGRQQLARGHRAWRTPAMHSWHGWLGQLVTSAELGGALPARLNEHQGRVLWERCLRREVSDPLLNVPILVRQAREAWSRLHEFSLTLDECESAALGRDQRLFVRAARSYQSILDREGWIDGDGLAGLLTQLVIDGRVSLPNKVTLAGFDRLVPQSAALLDAMTEAGLDVSEAPPGGPSSTLCVHSYENADAEMRAAGAWARHELLENPDQVIGIVATHLEQNSVNYARMIREGLAPGWQTAAVKYEASVNVSYGRKLSAYPAIAIALSALRWLQDDLPGRDICALLRSQLIGNPETDGRSRLELYLREFPDRHWSPTMLKEALDNRDQTPDAIDWFMRIESLGRLRSELPRRASPPEWAVLIDAALTELNWPGGNKIGSSAFQLVNRWRELLNDLSRLRNVSPSMTYAEAYARLSTMAAETVYQAESGDAIVQLMGPLEAAGMHFDQLWISGLTVENWPAASRPSYLLSRQLQRQYGMPDSDPEDTLDYSRRMLARLLTSAERVVGSFPLTDGDAEQTQSGLLNEFAVREAPGPDDPGWHAARDIRTRGPVVVNTDPVPAVSAAESVSGGAATIQRQVTEPFSAFVFGRLGVRYMPRITTGLAATLRGSLIHDALHNLYSDLPSRSDIAAWNPADIDVRIQKALHSAFDRHERYTDAVLSSLLQLERQRVARLIREVITLDSDRGDFRIADVEAFNVAVIGGLELRLRIDRIDSLNDGSVMILDYKTGARRRFLDRQKHPHDLQLVVYSCALKDPVAGLGIVNIDSRTTGLEGAGPELTPDLDWPDALLQWQDEVVAATNGIRRGDIRINGAQANQKSRPYALLSRISELKRGV